MIENKINYCYYLVAFIDILGQKEAFQNLDNENIGDINKKLIEVHKQTTLYVETLRKAFKEYFDAFTAKKEPSVQLDPLRKEEVNALLKSNLKHQRFSDCIQAYVCLHTDKYQLNAINGIFGVLGACGGLLLFSLASKKSFRAGVEVGLGIELENGEIYGPALYKAYELESKVAGYPRIVIGRALINYLRLTINKPHESPGQIKEDFELCKIIASKCLNMVVEDLDGVPILDYLGNDFQQMIKLNTEAADTYKTMYDSALQFVKSEYENRKRSGDKKLSLRYFLLMHYLMNKFVNT